MQHQIIIYNFRRKPRNRWSIEPTWSIDSRPAQIYRCRKQGYIVPQPHPYIITNSTNYFFLRTQYVGSFEWCRMNLGAVITVCHSFASFVTKHRYPSELGYWSMQDRINSSNRAFLMRSHARHGQRQHRTIRKTKLLGAYVENRQWLNVTWGFASINIETVLPHDQLQKLLILTAAICNSRIGNLTRHRRLPGIGRWEIYI